MGLVSTSIYLPPKSKSKDLLKTKTEDTKNKYMVTFNYYSIKSRGCLKLKSGNKYHDNTEVLCGLYCINVDKIECLKFN